MTAADDKKAKLHQALATLEEVLDEVIDEGTAPVVDEPPASGGDTGQDDQPPTGEDTGGQDTPPPVPTIADPAKVFTVVAPYDAMPAADGSNTLMIVVPNEYGTVNWHWSSGGPYGDQVKALAAPDDDHVSWVEFHGSGQTVVFHKNAKLFLWGGEIYPQNIPNAPTSGGGGSSGPSMPPPAQTPPEPKASLDAAAPVAPDRMSVAVTIDGVRTVYSGADAIDLGDYVGFAGTFTQKNFMLRTPDDVVIFFRPDATSGRMEIVRELGDAFDPAYNLGEHSVEILLDGKVIDTVAVPVHYWNSRWRWQSSLRPAVKSPADIFAMKAYFPFAVLQANQQPVPVAPACTPETISDMIAAEGTTGERAEIGLVTDNTGWWLATGHPTAEYNIRQEAEAAAAFPIHRRDSKTNRPLSWLDYPKANTYSEQSYSTPQISRASDCPFQWDGAHNPSLALLMFLISGGDLYHLEELQFDANAHIHGEPSTPDLFDPIQTRGTAWAIKAFLDARYATAMANSKTGTLLTADYFDHWLDINFDRFMTQNVNATDVKNAVFFSGTDPVRLPPWQEDYLAVVLGNAVWRGYEKARPVFAWKIKSNIARSDPNSGIPAGNPSWYYTIWNVPAVPDPSNKGDVIPFFQPALSAPDGEYTIVVDAAGGGSVNDANGDHVQWGIMPFAVPDGASLTAGDRYTAHVVVPKTWAALSEAIGLVEHPDNSVDPSLDDYIMSHRAALVMAEALGFDVKANCDLTDAQIAKMGWSVLWRYSVQRQAA